MEAQASTSKPSSRARARATDTTRSLNECVGLAASFLTHTSPRPRRCGQAVGAHQRRAAGGQREARRLAGGRPRLGRQRQEVGVAPQVLRPALDAPAQRAATSTSPAAGGSAPPAARSSARTRSWRRARTSAPHSLQAQRPPVGPWLVLALVLVRSHQKNLRPGDMAEVPEALCPHLPGLLGACRIWHRPRRRLLTEWLPGLRRASPSTPLDAYGYVGASIARAPDALKADRPRPRRRYTGPQRRTASERRPAK